MKHTTKLLLILALVASAVPSVHAASNARKSDVARPTGLSASGARDPVAQSWWGEASKIGCRVGLRYIGTPGFAAFGGFCGIWLLDLIIN